MDKKVDKELFQQFKQFGDFESFFAHNKSTPEAIQRNERENREKKGYDKIDGFIKKNEIEFGKSDKNGFDQIVRDNMVNKKSDIQNDDCITILHKVEQKCFINEDIHKEQYFKYKSKLIYFKVPVIILSSINSVISVGLQEYVSNQETISTITCGLALCCSILTSIELYLKIELSLTRELESSKSYNALGLRIQKFLLLDQHHRQSYPNDFLTDVYAEYLKLHQASKLLRGFNELHDNKTRNLFLKYMKQGIEDDKKQSWCKKIFYPKCCDKTTYKEEGLELEKFSYQLKRYNDLERYNNNNGELGEGNALKNNHIDDLCKDVDIELMYKNNERNMKNITNMEEGNIEEDTGIVTENLNNIESSNEDLIIDDFTSSKEI
jgi:hypothetical protein